MRSDKGNQFVFKSPKKVITVLTNKTIEALRKRDGNGCSICNEENVQLEVHLIIPISKGGDNKLENLILICPKCRQSIEKKRELREFEFVNYLAKLLERSEKFRKVQTDAEIGKEKHFRADLVAEEKVNNEWQKIMIECKVHSSFTSNRLQRIIAQIESYSKCVEEAKLVFAFPGELSPKVYSSLESLEIEIWDLSFISKKFKEEIPLIPHPILQPLFMSIKPSLEKSPEEKLLQDLKLCESGRRNWVKYQKLVGTILERLFCPPLSTPIPELSDASKVNRRDFILPNYTEEGFWAFVRSRYSADHIVVDAKNLSGKVKKKEVLQISNYLKKHGAGLFGLIICRSGCDRSCLQTLREIWAIEKKLIIVLTDDDIEQMLLENSTGGQPETTIRQKIEEFRLAL